MFTDTPLRFTFYAYLDLICLSLIQGTNIAKLSEQEELRERKELESLNNPTYQDSQEKVKSVVNTNYQDRQKTSENQQEPLSDQISALKAELNQEESLGILKTNQIFKTSSRPCQRSVEVDQNASQNWDKNRSKSDSQKPSYQDLQVPCKVSDYTMLNY